MLKGLCKRNKSVFSVLVLLGLGLFLIYFWFAEARWILSRSKISRISYKPPETNSAILAEKTGLRLDRAVPDFKLKFLDGSTRQLSEYFQNVIILQFFITDCEDCFTQIKELEILDQITGENLVIFLVHRKDKEQITAGDLAKVSSTLPILVDEGGFFPLIFGSRDETLARLIIDKNDKVRFLDFGFESFDSLYKKVKKYL